MTRPSLFFVWPPQWFYSWPVKVVRGEDEYGWRTLGVVTWAGSIFVRTNYCGCCATPENGECPTCGGFGYHPHHRMEWHDVTCVDCNGTGRVTPENVEEPT